LIVACRFRYNKPALAPGAHASFDQAVPRSFSSVATFFCGEITR